MHACENLPFLMADALWCESTPLAPFSSKIPDLGRGASVDGDDSISRGVAAFASAPIHSALISTAFTVSNMMTLSQLACGHVLLADGDVCQSKV